MLSAMTVMGSLGRHRFARRFTSGYPVVPHNGAPTHDPQRKIRKEGKPRCKTHILYDYIIDDKYIECLGIPYA